MANIAGLTGIFKAWLSDSNTSARDRLVHHVGSYVRTDGAVVAINWFDLADGWLKEPIACDENKTCTTEPLSVWTGTERTGNHILGQVNCSDWTSESSTDNGMGGSNLEINFNWTDGFGWPCNWSNRRLYCIEQ